MGISQHLVKRVRIPALLILLAVISFLRVASARGETFSANIEPMGGLVQHQAANSTQWKTLADVTLFQPGDKLRTAENGVAEINTTTGIKVSIYPNTLIELDGLALSSDDSSLQFRLKQLVGLLYVSVDRTPVAGDFIQIALPGAAATVHGTKFYTGVGSNGESFVLGEDNTVEAQSADGEVLKTGADQLVYFPLAKPGEKPPATCSADFLKVNKGTLLTNLDSDAAKQVLLRFLAEYITSNANTRVTDNVARMLGITHQSDTELISSILKADVSVKLSDLLKDFRAFLRSYFDAHSSANLAPLTCGNGKKDSGEDNTNCKVDVVDVSATCGNNLCEADAGESHLNCSKDCFYSGANSCADKQGHPIDNKPGNQDKGTPPVKPPKPSGVGGTNP